MDAIPDFVSPCWRYVRTVEEWLWQEPNNHLSQVLRGLKDDYAAVGVSDVSVIVDSDIRVPWREVVNVMGLCQSEGLNKLEFARVRSR